MKRQARPVPAGAKFVSFPQLCERWSGISHMTLERRIKKDPKFPRPKRLGRLRIFEIAEVEAYERGLVTSRAGA